MVWLYVGVGGGTDRMLDIHQEDRQVMREMVSAGDGNERQREERDELGRW